MTNPSDRSPLRWSVAPTAKAKNLVQRCVTALLDELAPERVLKRVDRVPKSIEQHRTPEGCVLQAEKVALSVSWFAEPGNDALLGELHVILWHGTLQRRGAPRSRKSATVVTELVLRPIEPIADDCVWADAGGTRYDTASLTAKCVALLQEQLVALDQPSP